MADLANLLGGYGSGSSSDDEGGSGGDAPGPLFANATGVVVRAAGPADAAAASPGPAAGADSGPPGPAGGGPSLASGEEPPGSPSQAPRVMDGPSTNPEPPPEGLSPPVVAPAGSGLSGDEGGGGGGPRRGDPRLLLPPELRAPPPGPVDPVLQEKVALIDKVQRQKGLTVMSQLSKDRRWANPTFLDKMVDHFGLEPYGTCFRPEVWDPKALPEEDAWPRLEEELKAAAARRAEEAARRETVQFQSGGLQAPSAPTAAGLSGILGGGAAF